MLIPLILAGGSGTRLWPVSRSAYPKPFMRLGGDESLAQKTLRRAVAVSEGEVLSVTSRDLFFITRDEYDGVSDAEGRTLSFLLEPVGRNTAPAIAMAALYIKERHGSDAVMLVLPADHLIDDLAGFSAAVCVAHALAREGYLATFGVRPSRPETGYGYIQRGDAFPDGQGAAVKRFVEKPDLKTAQEYLESGEYLWNSGMFCFTAGAFLEALAEHQPDMLATAESCWQASDRDSDPVELPREQFEAFNNISVDYAVMEHADNAAVVEADFDWNDIGSWNAVSELVKSDEDGNRTTGRAVLVDSRNCYVQAGTRVVAVVGLDDLVVVDTGDAVLVAHRERAQDVRQVVDRLTADNEGVATFHQTVRRPWGSFTVLEESRRHKVKRLLVKPGQVLSLQLHHKRSEHWTVVSGTAKILIGDEELLLEANQSAYVPVNTKHRLENPGEENLEIIEVQCGEYLGEDDIVRFEDVYGRTEKNA